MQLTYIKLSTFMRFMRRHGMKIKALLIIISAIFVAACGLVTRYQANPNAPHARIGFYKNTFLMNENIGAIFKDYRTCKQSFNIPMFSAAITINAGHPTTIVVKHIISYNTVIFAFTFIPIKNYTYLITVKSHHKNGKIVTTLWLKHMRPDNKFKLWNTPLVARKYKLSLFSGSCSDYTINIFKAPHVHTITRKINYIPPPVIIIQK